MKWNCWCCVLREPEAVLIDWLTSLAITVPRFQLLVSSNSQAPAFRRCGLVSVAGVLWKLSPAVAVLL